VGLRLTSGGVLAALALPAVLFAHDGAAHAPLVGWSDWTFEPLVIGSLGLSGGLYLRGLRRLRRHPSGRRALRSWEISCFALAWMTLGLALLSPLDALSDILFSAHMGQHELLMIVAAPLSVIGRPSVAWLWGLPSRVRHGVAAVARDRRARSWWRWLSAPLVVFVLHGAVLWAWHWPALYEAALHDERVHGVQHFCFFATALLFWWSLVTGRYGRLGYGLAVVYVFLTSLHSGLLGALLTVAGRPIYATHALRTTEAGVDALGDQQLAGLLMWIPGGAVLMAIGLGLFAAWVGESGRRADLAEPVHEGRA
jgi:putative membrane protein